MFLACYNIAQYKTTTKYYCDSFQLDNFHSQDSRWTVALPVLLNITQLRKVLVDCPNISGHLSDTSKDMFKLPKVSGPASVVLKLFILVIHSGISSLALQISWQQCLVRVQHSAGVGTPKEKISSLGAFVAQSVQIFPNVILRLFYWRKNISI